MKIWSNQPSFEEWRKHKKDTEDKWIGAEENINGDKFPEFVVRDEKGFIQSADGLRITIPIKRQRVTKYFIENPTKAERQQKYYKYWKEEDKPADGYRYFIKHFLSPFLKERGYTVAQVYSVIEDIIWKGIFKLQKKKRDAKRRYEQEQYDNAMAKIRARKVPKFSERKSLENARLLPYEFENDLDDYIIENE
ncbi:MAG: hypothetical protein EZS28_011209 [Streblomastix strix]|uniref:Uncharacterized protein n=1 Tax=Streblomastix strix TaxID=222440 RepID=A0A5J4WEX2_9EUKA|nr:MAG: hypothetical protein EZS28_011209 [Streblomastix strix]